ncbi:MAG: glycoside hydrolase [Oscillospiraceae bacterium]|nr:glycoside hydrolase [Oscillospiraceae bacterium]
MKRLIAFFTAMTLPAVFCSAAMVHAAGEDTMHITVDLGGSGKSISPYIYGINEYGHQENLKKLSVNAIRQGGNRMVAYNWENNASNAGSDWKHSSDNNLSNSDAPADCVQQLVDEGEKYDIGYKLTTLQMAGYVSADKNGVVSEAEAAPSARWNRVQLTKGSAFAAEPDLTDGVVYMDEYVNYIIQKYGDSSAATGIQGYSLDNEPALWHHTHSRIHPQEVGITELRDKSVELATAVKQLDPDAEIFGPALYGYTAYDHLADSDSSTEWETLKAAGGYHWYLDYYLDSMKEASDAAGVRLLDVLDIHYYSESARVGAEDRLQSVRTLYEKGFVENSWIGQWCQENVPILPTVQASIDQYYPGTKLAVTEYNFGGDTDPSGAIAQAEALGCFADANVYFASLWGGSGYILSALNLYTNFDGKGGAFGDTLMPTTTDDVSLSSAYAAIDGADDSTVTVMVTNKNMTQPMNATIALQNADSTYKKAAVYAITPESDEITLLEIVDTAADAVDITLPAYCAAMVVISEDAAAFDGTQEEKPVEESVVYDDPMSMINENGYVEIPITDAEHLKEIIITANVTSKAGSSWGNAGCAVCINAVTPEGEEFWTSKSYGLDLGSGVKAVVEFDGTLSHKENGDIPAVIADGKVELQKWWDSSEKMELDQEDEIIITYTSVEVVYEYPAQPEENNTLPGDVNCDGLVKINDVILLNRVLAEDTSAAITEQGMLNAECDGSPTVTADDAVTILRGLAGLK